MQAKIRRIKPILEDNQRKSSWKLKFFYYSNLKLTLNFSSWKEINDYHTWWKSWKLKMNCRKITIWKTRIWNHLHLKSKEKTSRRNGAQYLRIQSSRWKTWKSAWIWSKIWRISKKSWSQCSSYLRKQTLISLPAKCLQGLSQCKWWSCKSKNPQRQKDNRPIFQSRRSSRSNKKKKSRWSK